jgi:hypothetical protein
MRQGRYSQLLRRKTVVGGNHIVTNNNIGTQQNNNMTININAFSAEDIEHLL